MNTLYFSAELNTFFDDSIHESIPTSAIEVTQEQHHLMLDHLNSGGRVDHVGENFVLIAAAPDVYHIWNETNKVWETNDELQTKKQTDADSLKQTEIAALLTQAARKVSEYQDLVDFAETPAEIEAGKVGLLAWRQYRAALMKYQKELIFSLPNAPE